MDFKIHVSYRLLWYAALIWLATFVISNIVVLPWSYLASFFLISIASVLYVRGEVLKFIKKRAPRDVIFEIGLFAAMTWFCAIAAISVLEIIGLYYFNAVLFFSDIRNWIIFPLILTLPVLYSIVLENSSKKKKNNQTKSGFFAKNLFFKPF